MRGILLVDHGSRAAEANAVVERVAEALGRRRPDAIVEVAHMELAEPSIATGLARCAARGADDVVVCPYFLASGRHSRDDIPKLVADARAAHPGLRVAIAEPLGFDERLVELVLARADAVSAE
jgi:sirohydrochlorin ferrochelatase